MDTATWRKMLNSLYEIKKGWYVEAMNKKTKEKVEGKVTDIFSRGSAKHYKLDGNVTINDKEWSINSMG